MVRMFWSYRVADWDSWSRSFHVVTRNDPNARQRRERYGMQQLCVYRSVDDPSEVMLVADFDTRAGAEALLKDPEGMRRWYERTGLEVFPPVLITDPADDLHWVR